MQRKDKLEMLLLSLRLTSKCNTKCAKLEIDGETCKYLYELVCKDVIENNIPINFELLKEK